MLYIYVGSILLFIKGKIPQNLANSDIPCRYFISWMDS